MKGRHNRNRLSVRLSAFTVTEVPQGRHQFKIPRRRKLVDGTPHITSQEFRKIQSMVASRGIKEAEAMAILGIAQ